MNGQVSDIDILRAAAEVLTRRSMAVVVGDKSAFQTLLQSMIAVHTGVFSYANWKRSISPSRNCRTIYDPNL